MVYKGLYKDTDNYRKFFKTKMTFDTTRVKLHETQDYIMTNPSFHTLSMVVNCVISDFRFDRFGEIWLNQRLQVLNFVIRPRKSELVERLFVLQRTLDSSVD